MANKRTKYPEAILTYYQEGARERIRTAADTGGLSISAFTRLAVMAKVQEEEVKATDLSRYMAEN